MTLPLGRRLVPLGFLRMPVCVPLEAFVWTSSGSRRPELHAFSRAFRAFFPIRGAWLPGPPLERMKPVVEREEFSPMPGFDELAEERFAALAA